MLVVTLSTNDNGKPLQQLKSRFKHTVNWNKYQSKTTTQNAPNQYSNYLIDPSLIDVLVNRLPILFFIANDSRIGHSRIYLPISKVKDYNVMIDGKNLFARLQLLYKHF